MINAPNPRHFAIIPAAGHSRRMGRPKLLLPWRDRTVIETVIEAWQQGGVDQVVVVCRQHDAALIQLCQATGAVVIDSADELPQMKDSVAAGLREIATRFDPRGHDAWLMAPADLPRLSPAVIQQLLDAHDPSRPDILTPVHEGRRGHPILLPWHMAAEVHQLGDERGVNHLLQQHTVREIIAGPAALPRDMDTPEDYRRLQQD